MKRMTPETYRKIKSMLVYGARYAAIASVTGYSRTTVANVAHGRLPMPTPRRTIPSIVEVLGPVKTTPGDPSPAEIREACEKLIRHRPRGFVFATPATGGAS